MNSTSHNVLNAAYLYYYATDVAFQAGAEEDGSLKKRLEDLVNDAFVVADQAKFDVFNALSLMDNMKFISDLRVSRAAVSIALAALTLAQFGAGDGLLNFYLYNWRTTALAGINKIGGVDPGMGIGVVML